MGEIVPYKPESWLNMRFLQDNIKDMDRRNGRDDFNFDLALTKQRRMYKEFISEYVQDTIH